VIRDRDALIQAQPLTADQLRQILANFPTRVRACVLNTCESLSIANALVSNNVVDFAIGWDAKVSDPTAIQFATTLFYRHLAEGLSYGQAFGLAQACCPPGPPAAQLCHAEGTDPKTVFAVQT